MKTLTVELKNSNALRLLKDLELANIIKLIYPDNEKKTTKLSSRLRGSISKERANELNIQLEQMRMEWENRNI
jgi:hypothetical protein